MFAALTATLSLATKVAPRLLAEVTLPMSLMVNAAPTATFEPIVAAPARAPMKESSLAPMTMPVAFNEVLPVAVSGPTATVVWLAIAL